MLPLFLQSTYLRFLVRILTHKITIGILLSIAFFFGAVFCVPMLVNLLRNNLSVQVLIRDGWRETLDVLLFLFSVTIIPFFLILLWHYLPIVSLKRKFISILVTIICVIAGLTLRLFIIRMEASARQAAFKERIAGKYSSENFPAPGFVNAQDLQFGIYTIAALILTAVISYWLLKEEKKIVPILSFEQEQS